MTPPVPDSKARATRRQKEHVTTCGFLITAIVPCQVTEGRRLSRNFRYALRPDPQYIYF